jgi:hypothetical protein
MAKIEGIFIAPESAAPTQSLQTATLIRGIGIEGDRYALGTGTYSAKFLKEPGKSLTMVSADSLEAEMKSTGIEPLPLGTMRRNIVLRGITAETVNKMIGHEVKIGANCRLFIHRKCVPCKYREAQTGRTGLMNKLWDVCGVNCEILEGGVIHVGDAVDVIPNTHQPNRVNPGHKPPPFFIKPSERTPEQVKQMVIPPLIAGIMCFVDPAGFMRLESGYGSVGLKFWSSEAYAVGMAVKKVRTPLLITAGLAVLTTAIGIAVKSSRHGNMVEAAKSVLLPRSLFSR